MLGMPFTLRMDDVELGFKALDSLGQLFVLNVVVVVVVVAGLLITVSGILWRCGERYWGVLQFQPDLGHGATCSRRMFFCSDRDERPQTNNLFDTLVPRLFQ